MTGIKIPFNISEYIARPDLPTTVEVMDKILQNHIRVMLPVRAALGAPISVSLKSGFRHPIHEVQKKRSGTGEHTYTGKGAADYTTAAESFVRFAELMAQSEYTRLCFYPNERFIHADHKATTKQFFTQQTPADGWKVVSSADEWLSAVRKAVEGWSK
jgi:hypothetical protein